MSQPQTSEPSVCEFVAVALTKAFELDIRTHASFFDAFPIPRLLALISNPELRATLIEEMTGTRHAIASRLSDAAATEQIQIALEMGEAEPAVFLRIVTPLAWTNTLKAPAIWSFITEPLCSSDASDPPRNAATMAAFLLEEGLRRGLVTAENVVSAIGLRRLLETVDVTAVIEAFVGFDGGEDHRDYAAILRAIPPSAFIGPIPVAGVVALVITPHVAKACGLLRSPDAEVPWDVTDADLHSIPTTPPPSGPLHGASPKGDRADGDAMPAAAMTGDGEGAVEYAAPDIKTPVPNAEQAAPFESPEPPPPNLAPSEPPDDDVRISIRPVPLNDRSIFDALSDEPPDDARPTGYVADADFEAAGGTKRGEGGTAMDGGSFPLSGRIEVVGLLTTEGVIPADGGGLRPLKLNVLSTDELSTGAIGLHSILTAALREIDPAYASVHGDKADLGRALCHEVGRRNPNAAQRLETILDDMGSIAKALPGHSATQAQTAPIAPPKPPSRPSLPVPRPRASSKPGAPSRAPSNRR